MSTRSAIAIQQADGTIYAVYCHYDGYFSYVGKILFESYNDRDKVQELISYGDISVLRREVGVQHPFSNSYMRNTPEWHSYEQAYSEMTTFYGRDRCEQGTDADAFQTKQQFVDGMRERGAEYFYLFTVDNEWRTMIGKNGMLALEDVLINEGIIFTTNSADDEPVNDPSVSFFKANAKDTLLEMVDDGYVDPVYALKLLLDKLDEDTLWEILRDEYYADVPDDVSN